jgi:hypothetical protein
MSNTVYESATITTIDGKRIYITPLKIKHMRDFMAEFESVKGASDDGEAISHLVRCATIAMRQYCPEIQTEDQFEDNFDLQTVYKILEIAAGIKFTKASADKDVEDVAKQASSQKGGSWSDLDLAKLESEVFLLGIWKDYEELESSLSMPELTAVLNAKRESDYDHKKFLAAIQGIDLDKQKGSSRNEWEDLKARVFSKGKTNNSNDIVSLQGANATKAGFGIGMGLDYEDMG